MWNYQWLLKDNGMRKVVNHAIYPSHQYLLRNKAFKEKDGEGSVSWWNKTLFRAV